MRGEDMMMIFGGKEKGDKKTYEAKRHKSVWRSKWVSIERGWTTWQMVFFVGLDNLCIGHESEYRSPNTVVLMHIFLLPQHHHPDCFHFSSSLVSLLLSSLVSLILPSKPLRIVNVAQFDPKPLCICCRERQCRGTYIERRDEEKACLLPEQYQWRLDKRDGSKIFCEDTGKEDCLPITS